MMETAINLAIAFGEIFLTLLLVCAILPLITLIVNKDWRL